MKIYLLIYLLFQLVYDHWAQDTAFWWVVYYSFQYGFIAALAVREMIKTRKIVYLFLSIPFIALALDEWLGVYLNLETREMSSLPVYNLTLFAIALFIIFELIQWKKRLSGSRGRI